MTWNRSVCPHDCPDTCGLLVETEGNRVVKIKGDPDHPFTAGSLCVKVNHYLERINSPDRLMHPLRRVGPKGSGKFERIGWGEAMDEIAGRYDAVMKEYGGRAVLPFYYAGTMGLVANNAGHAFFSRLGACKMLPTVCSATVSAGFEAGMGPTPSMDPETAVHSDLIIIWGSNTLATNVHAWPFFQKAKKNGARIVVVDPYANETAKKADRHLRPLPGTDAALALGLMHVLVEENLTDNEFINAQTIGFEQLKERIREYPPQTASEITQVPVDDIVRLAREYGGAKAPLIRLGWGPGRQLKGGMAIRTVSLLPGLVGATPKKGGGIYRSCGAAFQLNLKDLVGDDLAPSDRKEVNMIGLGRALNEPVDLPVKLLHVYHCNPAVIVPDSNAVRRGLARDDLFTVVHEMFMTDTARMADIVLPGACSLETDDLFRSYGHYYLQMAHAVVPPPGECRSALSIFQELAGRLGFTEKCFSMTEKDFIRAMLNTDSEYLSGITYETVAEGKPVRLNVPDIPMEAGFNTPSGKIEFFSKAMADLGLDPLPDGSPSIDTEGEGKYPLHLITPPNSRFLNSTFSEVKSLADMAGAPSVKIHPEQAEERGIRHGDMVDVFNDRGTCRLTADVTADATPGVLIAEGLHRPGAIAGYTGINCLTGQAENDMGGSCAFHGNLVEVKPAVE